MLNSGSSSEFEFDEEKSRLNKLKHGIDFVEAQVLWLDGDQAQILVQEEGEERWMVIGTIGGKLWSAVITYREKRVRIISVRRSRPEEEVLYEEEGRAHYR